MLHHDMVLRVPNTPRDDPLGAAHGCMLAVLLGTLIWTAIIVVIWSWLS
jgi:hypothetical protein